MGVLTKYLLNKPVTTYVIEIDTESVTYLDENHPKLKRSHKIFEDINEILRGSSSLSLGIPIQYFDKLF
jgi:16S rRNA (adenine1518-N6/adenine1519-N6)-dimethyltransferase